MMGAELMKFIYSFGRGPDMFLLSTTLEGGLCCWFALRAHQTRSLAFSGIQQVIVHFVSIACAQNNSSGGEAALFLVFRGMLTIVCQ